MTVNKRPPAKPPHTKRHAGSRRDGALTDDERLLWDHVTEHVHPLRRATLVHIDDDANAEHADEAREPLPDVEVAPAHKPRWQKLISTGTPRPAKPSPPAQPTFDRKHAKRIARGNVEIEGRIDLHGLRESEAHVRLRGFLRQAQAQGKRTVLVITGKGRENVDPYAPFDFGADRAPRGVLNRNVPRWLSEPDMASLVVSHTPAHTRHGGDGALYVHLRRLRD